MIIETKLVGAWLLLLTGGIGAALGAQVAAQTTALPWLGVLLSALGFLIALILAAMGWVLRQVHVELRRLADEIPEIRTTLYGAKGQGGLVRQVEHLDEEKLSEHRVNNLIARYHAEHHSAKRASGESRGRDL